MKNKKIAFITPLYLPANITGSGVVIKQLAEGLSKKGYDCSIITSNGLSTRWWYDPIFGKKIGIDHETINGVKVYRLPCRQLLSFISLVLVRYFKSLLPRSLFNKLQLLYSGPNIAGLKYILEKRQFDVIYTSPFPVYLNKQVADTVPKLSYKPKLIFSPHFHAMLPDYHNPELGKVFIDSALIHVKTKAEKNDIQEIFKVPDEKFLIIPLFLKISELREYNKLEEQVLRFKNQYNLQDKKIILFAGSKIKEKGVFTLAKAVENLSKKNNKHVLVTIGNSSSMWDTFKKDRNEKCLIDLGFVDDRVKEIAFAACDIFCLPSICESFGLVYLEAWHKKKPVIGANIPIVKELIQKSNGGLLVEFDNVRNLEEAIEMISADDALAKKLGENGYKKLINNYTLKNFLDKFEKSI